MTMEVTQRVEFECCYIFNGEIESHRCKMEVTVEGPQRYQDHGVVITYDSLRKYMLSVVPNKSFLYSIEDVDGVRVNKAFTDAGCRTQGYNFPLSSENLCKHFAETLQALFDTAEPGIVILNMKLREDNNSFVSWSRYSN